MGSTAEQRGYHFNSSSRTAEQHLPGRRSTQGSLENQNTKSTRTGNASQNGDWNFTASQPSNFCDKPKQSESPITQNESYYSNDANSSCTQSSVAGWAVRPKLRKSATSAASDPRSPRTEELPKALTTKPKTQWKTLEVDLPSQAFVQQQQTPTNSAVNNAWAARNQTKKLDYTSLNSHQLSALHDEQMQVQQDALLAIKLQKEEDQLAAAWQRGGRKKQLVNQSSEAFPALLPPPSVLQGENTLTSKPQENAEAQKLVSTFNSVGSQLSPANVAKLPVNSSSLIQSTIPLENVTEKKTVSVNENVELFHDYIGEVFQSDEDFSSDNEGVVDQTHDGGFEVVGNSEKAGTATFPNRNLGNHPKRDGTATSATFPNQNLANQEKAGTATSVTFSNRSLANQEKAGTATSANFSNRNLANPEKAGTAASATFPNRNLANPKRDGTATSATFPNRNLANPEKAGTATSANFSNRNLANPEKVDTAPSASFPNKNLANPEKVDTATFINFPKRNLANPEKAGTVPYANFPNQNLANPEKAGTVRSANFPNRNLANPEKADTDPFANFPNRNLANLEKVDTATSVNFPNQNLANPATFTDRNLANHQQFTASVTTAASIYTPQAQSEFHNATSKEGLMNQMSKKSPQESVLKTPIGPANSPTPVTETVVIPMQQVAVGPLPPNPTDVLYLAEHIAFVKARTENAHCVAKEAQDHWRKLEAVTFKIEDTFNGLQNVNTMGMPVLQHNIISGFNALRTSLTTGLTVAKAFLQRYDTPPNPSQNTVEPILMSLPGGGTAVMMRSTSAPQHHPLVVDAFSLGMTAVNLYRKIREEWAGSHPVSSISETNVLRCKEKVEALQRQQHPQQIQNLISEVCCDALFICNLALDMVTHSRQLPKSNNAP